MVFKWWLIVYPVCALIARLQLAVEFFSLFLNGKDGSKLFFFP